MAVCCKLSIFGIFFLTVIYNGVQSIPGEKLGHCRHLVPGGPERERCHPDLCQTSADCPGIELCCFDGCAKACSQPQLVKPGICPRPDIRAGVGHSCQHDYHCPGTQKCCTMSTGCGVGCSAKVCVSPRKLFRFSDFSRIQ